MSLESHIFFAHQSYMLPVLSGSCQGPVPLWAIVVHQLQVLKLSYITLETCLPWPKTIPNLTFKESFSIST